MGTFDDAGLYKGGGIEFTFRCVFARARLTVEAVEYDTFLFWTDTTRRHELHSHGRPLGFLVTVAVFSIDSRTLCILTSTRIATKVLIFCQRSSGY